MYINSRVLDLTSSSPQRSTLSSIRKRSPADLTEAELVQLEGELMEEEGISDIESIDEDLDED
jgi:hypothetical protein